MPQGKPHHPKSAQNAIALCLSFLPQRLQQIDGTDLKEDIATKDQTL